MTTYLIKMVICSGVLFLFYHLLLEKEKMHRYNRFFLLLSLAVSLLAPLISFEWQQDKIVLSEPVYVVSNVLDRTEEIIQTNSINEKENNVAISPVLLFYLLVSVALLVKFSRNLFRLLSRINRTERIPYHDATLVLLQHESHTFSFLNYIFVQANAWKEGSIRPEVLQHELAHTKQKHSWDILLIEILLVVAWFNPFYYFYKKAIRLNHEYLADDAVVRNGNKHFYQHLLLDTISSSQMELASSFVYLTTKKRILMMLKTTSRLSSGLRQVGTILSSLLLIFFLSSKIMAQQKEPVPAQKTPETKKRDTSKLLPWVGQTIGFTKEGVSDELLKEYGALVSKYFGNNNSPVKQFDNVTEEDRVRMEEIFKQMNLEQQGKQRVAFLKPPRPLPKVVPTKEQFEKYKNPKIFGVWIDEKKVSNEVLNNYSNTDFSQVFVSKLYGAAKKGRSYTHQLDLMTNDHYKKYYEKAINNKRNTMVFRAPTKTRIAGYE